MSHTQRQRRLRLAQANWNMQDRERGYTTYRNGRPHAPARSVKRNNELLKESLLLVAVLIVGWLWLVV